MEGTDHDQLTRLASRQRKQKLFKSANQTQLKPLRQKRLALISALETATTDFLASALSSTADEALAPFDQVFAQLDNGLSLRQLRDGLLRQSQKASERCKRYEKEFNIYHLGETLPELEERLTHTRNIMLAARRKAEAQTLQLQPIFTLNEHLTARQKPILDHITLAGPYARPASTLRHSVRWLKDRSYREVCRAIARIEKTHGSLAEQIRLFAQSQTELLVREHEHDVLTREVETSRSWLHAYVDSWSSRLSEAQVLTALREMLADQMQSPDFRAALEASPTTRLPEGLRQLYREVEALDHRISHFYTSFEARHAAGRIETTDGEMQDRRRTPSTVGTTS